MASDATTFEPGPFTPITPAPRGSVIAIQKPKIERRIRQGITGSIAAYVGELERTMRLLREYADHQLGEIRQLRAELRRVTLERNFHADTIERLKAKTGEQST